MKLESLLRAAFFAKGLQGRWGINLLLQGPPGTAKTARIGQATSDMGLPMEGIIASLREPADFLGLPVPDGHGGVQYLPGRWAQNMAKATRGVVFLDELSTSAPAVQAALLRVVTEGVVGDLALPPGIRFVAAQNAVEHAANGYDLSLPLANRFCHLAELGVSVSDWASWLMSGDTGSSSTKDPAAHEAEVEKAWATPFAKASGATIAFLRRSDRLLQLPKSDDPAASKAWPSPRSWEMAVRLMASAEIHSLTPAETDALIAGCIGHGVATEFVAFRKNVDLPDPAALLDGKVGWEHDDRLDRTQATLAACAALVCPKDADRRIDRTKALYDLIKPLVKEHGDLVNVVVETLVKSQLGALEVGDQAKVVLKSLMPSRVAAGKLTVRK